jgi:outer membrane lipoprotein LolB
MSRRLPVLAAVVLLAAGCRSMAPREPLPPARRAAAMAAQDAREAALAGARDWAFSGRLAVSSHGRGGSGHVEWRQRGEAFDVTLAAPITRQSWRLVGDGGASRLEGLDGGTRTGGDPALLLREATGWDIPVTALASWVRGARAPGGPAALEFSADGRLARLQQDGWTLDYEAWQPPSQGGPVELPTRISAERGDARVRLVVDDWSPGTGP